MKTTKTWLVLIASTMLILGFGISTAYATPSVCIDPASSPVANAGDSFDVDVLVDPAGEALAGGTVELSFNASVLSITAHSKGTIFSCDSADMGSEWSTPGYAKINLAGMGCTATTQGTWAAITFEVADGTLNGTYDIEITSATLKYGDTTVIPGTTTTNGTVTVGEEAGPTLDVFTVNPTTVTQGETVDIDIEFSEEVSWVINVNNSTGATVESWDGTSTNPIVKHWETTTDTPVGDYVVDVFMNGALADSETVTVEPAVNPMTVAADPTSVTENTATDVKFTVTSDGSAVDGALVTLLGCGVDTNGTTGADGTVNISVTATSAGTINVTATKDGYDDAATSVAADPASTAPSVCIDPASSPVANAGDSFDVDVLVDPAGEALAGGTVELSFNASVLSITAHSPGTIFSCSSSDMGSEWSTPGYAKINLAAMGCTATTQGTWAAITFEVADGTLNGTYDIEITSATLKYGDTTAIPGTTTTNGTVTVGEAAEPPELISCVIDPTPPVEQGTNISIDCLFSEKVTYEIRIENATGDLVEEIGSGTATNPKKKWWNTTTETTAGIYTVNVTMDNSTSGLSSYNNTNTIEVTEPSGEDTTPPDITAITCTTPTSDSVTITWTTDEGSDSLVKYGTETGVYTDNESNATRVTSHSIALTGLTPETTYYFVVNSTDESGNPAESDEYNFTTAAVPIVEITDWTLDDTGTCGTSIDAAVNITNTGAETLWFVVSVSGTETTTGYPIVGLGTVQLDAGDSINVPVKIVVPGSADAGEYTLIPVVYKLDDYPAGNPEAVGSGESVTIS